ncbi:carboxyvinyl-carboxyphosphonate phosphorylmutase [Klebsiella pneumoniae]|nr:carboxyvinyl-carboxyphosphonate phosphorylmutase [Klebsiella pneumoniae]
MVDGTRRLDDAERFAVKLQEITRACPGLFVNVRTDTFLLNVQDALVQNALSRSTLRQTRRMRFFVPCVTRRGGYYRHRSPRAFTLKRNVYA